MNYSLETSSKRAPDVGKSNVTLWKSKYAQPHHQHEEKVIEDEYIENLKKQVHFMEMELKLLKEREKEIEKTGGFTQLFNDDRDPSQHILQLKQKYANMRKKQEAQTIDLTKKQKEKYAVNETLRSKLDVLKKFEKELYDKLVNLEDKSQQKIQFLENEIFKKNKERLELDSNNKLKGIELRNTIQENMELEYSILSNQKLEQIKDENFELTELNMERVTKDKVQEFEKVNQQIKDLEKKTAEEPVFKIEQEKNIEYKKKMEILETSLLSLNSQVETLELSNEHLIKRKEEVIANRKKLINQNDVLKKEIEDKKQLNEVRINKKVKDNNSEEIQKLDAHLTSIKNTITEVNGKIDKEIEKTKTFSLEIIKLNLDMSIKNKTREAVVESVDSKLKELDDLKLTLEELKTKHLALKDRIQKENINNQLLKNRNKVQMEEYTGVKSKFEYTASNNDYTSNLKKISFEDLKNVSTSNNLVNESIATFVNKVGQFKKQNIQSLLDV